MSLEGRTLCLGLLKHPCSPRVEAVEIAVDVEVFGTRKARGANQVEPSGITERGLVGSKAVDIADGSRVYWETVVKAIAEAWIEGRVNMAEWGFTQSSLI